MARPLAVILLLALLLLLVLAISAEVVRTETEAERRDEAALIAHYGGQGQEVEILETVEWPSFETCYQVKLHQRGAAEAQERVAMLSAGSSDLPYEFSGEFETLDECQAHFSRG